MPRTSGSARVSRQSEFFSIVSRHGVRSSTRAGSDPLPAAKPATPSVDIASAIAAAHLEIKTDEKERLSQIIESTITAGIDFAMADILSQLSTTPAVFDVEEFLPTIIEILKMSEDERHAAFAGARDDSGTKLAINMRNETVRSAMRPVEGDPSMAERIFDLLHDEIEGKIAPVLNDLDKTVDSAIETSRIAGQDEQKNIAPVSSVQLRKQERLARIEEGSQKCIEQSQQISSFLYEIYLCEEQKEQLAVQLDQAEQPQRVAVRTGDKSKIAAATENMEELTRQLKSEDQRIQRLDQKLEDYLSDILERGNAPQSNRKNSGAEALDIIKSAKTEAGSSPSADESRKLKNAILTLLRHTALQHGPIIPFLIRLVRCGPGGWKVPLVSEIKAVMDELNRAGEHGVSDIVRFEAQEHAIKEFERLGFRCCGMPALMKESGATEHQDRLQQLACMAANFTTANESLFNVMREKMPEKIDDIEKTHGLFLGPFVEKRQSRAEHKDALSILEAMVLSIETFGRRAQDEVKDKMKVARALFHHNNVTKAMKQFRSI
eukprot:COSAG01_NODE_8695_length_2694_cov_11.670906_4_plen_548_part_01